MFEYRETEKFDIGAGYGEYEYDFFMINGKNDFWKLINHYRTVYRRFNYFLDGYKKTKNNTTLSPFVKVMMKEHNANLCLTLLDAEYKEDYTAIREMIINIEKPNGIYETYFFYFYYCITVGAKDYLEHGHAYGKSGLHNAAIKHFTHAIKLDPSMGLAFYYRGISYLHRKEHAKAIEDFTQAISFHTEVSGCFMFRGFAHKEIGDFEKANADIAKFLELNPGDKFANECFEEITKAQVRG